MRQRAFYLAMVLIVLSLVPGRVPVAGSEEAEFVIARYGSVMVKSSVLDAKVFIDDIASGSVNTVIESVPIGNHMVACRTAEGKAVLGRFSVVKNETLRLEALFDEKQLIDSTEAERAAEAARKKKAEAAKLEEQKKTVVEVKKPEPKKAETITKKPEQKKAEAKNPKDAFRELHLNIIKVYPESEAAELHVTSKVNPQVITKYTETKNQSGKYYRTKQGLLLCEAGPCQKTWSSTFVYTDEAGKSDSILVRWHEIIFNGMTPSGTSKRELEFCLNGACQKREDVGVSDSVRELILDRYSVGWTKSLIAVRRTDVIKEIQDAGGNMANY